MSKSFLVSAWNSCFSCEDCIDEEAEYDLLCNEYGEKLEELPLLTTPAFIVSIEGGQALNDCMPLAPQRCAMV